jgi:hypothetical protein
VVFDEWNRFENYWVAQKVSSQKIMAGLDKVVRASRPDQGRDGLVTFLCFALP